MINLDQLYSIKQKIPKFIRGIFPKLDIFRYYFLKTNLSKYGGSSELPILC